MTNIFKNDIIVMLCRGVAQFGRVHDWGSWCRRFKSCHSDQQRTHFCLPKVCSLFIQADRLGISSRGSVNITKRQSRLYLITPLGVHTFSVGLMICHSFGMDDMQLLATDDIQHFVLIYLRSYDIMCVQIV